MGQPIVQAGAFRLRDFGPADAELVRSVSTDPMIPLTTTVPTSTGEADVQAYIERQHNRLPSGVGYSFAIARGADDVAVGYIGLTFIDDVRASVGYWIGPEHRGHGTAAVVLRALSGWALSDLAISRLELYVEPGNVASIRTAEAAGFERGELLESWRLVGDVWRDMWMYARLKGR